MLCPVIDYHEAVPLMKPGDVIAFGDDSAMSRAIQRATNSDVGHLAVVRWVFAAPWVGLVEARAWHVVRTWLHKRLADYACGRVYWLRLSDEFREAVDWDAAMSWLEAQVGKRYGLGQAVRSAFPTFSRWFGNSESFARLHCSEVVAGMFKAGHAPGFEYWNASEATPQDPVRAQIYAEARRLGLGARLRNFNSAPPATMARAVNEDRRERS